MRDMLRYFEQCRGEMVAMIRQLVELESPSNDKAAADRCGAFIAAELERRGAGIKLHKRKQCGDQIEARFAGRGKPIMLLGHYDTVWNVGTLARMPWREKQGRLYGPGVFDMKSGIALLLFALDALKELRGGLPRTVIVSLNADEEVGSYSSRAQIEKLARLCEAVLVLEPAHGTAVKTARKGVGEFTMKVTGVAAHAGLDFTDGHSAVLELARQIERLASFTDLDRGVTVNAGLICGGTRRNVVAAEASAEIDLRFARQLDGARLERNILSMRPLNKKCRIEVTGGISRPPLERTEAVVSLYEQARGVARELGFELGEAAVGGGSDGNFTAAMGIPTLDGLGPVGEGAHAATESVEVAWLPRRAALLAGMIETLATD